MEVKKCEEKDLESGTKINGKEDNEINEKVYDKDEARKIAIILQQIEKHEKTIQTIACQGDRPPKSKGSTKALSCIWMGL